MWSRNYSCCVECGGNDTRHMAKGVCARCYLAKYRPANSSRIADSKRAWHESFVKGTDRGKLAREARNYDGMREPVLHRDGYHCVRCGSSESLVVHHIDRQGRGNTEPNNDLSNLETLCRSCHINEHRTEIINKRESEGWKRSKIDRWSREWDACRGCGTTRLPHSSHGYCRTCISHVDKAKI